MADERIDIEINDKIAATIPTKLREIGLNADKSEASVLRLKAALADINSGPTARLKEATDATTSSLNKELDAQKIVQTQRTANTAALDKELAARERIAAMVAKSIGIQEAENAALKARMAAGGPLTVAGGGNLSRGSIGAEAASLASAGKQVEASLAETEAVAVSRFAKIKLAGLSAYDAIRDAGATMAGNFKGFFGSGGASTIEKEGEAIAKMGGHAKGSSTAIRELLVLAREGGRGDFTRMAGSASILAGALGLLPYALGAAAVAAVGFGAAMFSLNTKEEKQSLRDYADTLGLTEREMRKLTNTTVDASGKLHEHNVLQIQFGDVMHGVLKTVEQGAASVARSWGITVESARNGTSSVLNFLRVFVSTLVGEIYAVCKFIYTEAYNLFVSAENVGTLVGNAIYLTFATVANGVILLFNGVAKVINLASEAVGKGDIVKPMTMLNANVGNLFNGLKSFKGQDFLADVRAGAAKTDSVFTRMGENIKGAARDRIKAEADAIKANRNPHKGPKGSDSDPKTKDDYLYEENNKLDQELSRMHMLKDAREEQQKLDAIEEEFIKRRMPLNAQEIENFKSKIHAIAEYKFVQAESDKIYEASIGPQRTYNSTLQAASELLNKGAISQRVYAQEVVKAGRALKEANDPLFALTEAMDVAEKAVLNYGRAVEDATYYESIRQAELKKGNVLSLTYVKGVNAETDALMRRNQALQQQKFVQSQVGSIVNPMIENRQFMDSKAQMYAEIDRLRQTDVIKESEAARAKHAVNAKYDELRLAGASAFFGELASLASSSNGKIAAIGKAAAVAQATIDGFVAVQKALASAPPPWNFALAAAVAIKTGAQVAGIVSTNVGSFDTGGQFMIDGKAGVDRNNINMNVSRGERVTIETPAQQRANDGKGTGNVNVPVKIINVSDPKEMLAHLESEEGGRIIFNHLQQNPNRVKQLVQGNG